MSNIEPTIELYPEHQKEYEMFEVERNLAPVVRTYDELRQALEVANGRTRVATSGYFNPPHKNHISNIVSSKYLPSEILDAHGLSHDIHLTVVVNGDWSADNKLGGKTFLDAETRADIVRAFVGVDLVFIHQAAEEHQGSLIKLGLFDLFTKGGDRDFASLPQPEQDAISNTGIVMIGNVGYDKCEGTESEVSSSKLRAAASA